MARLPIAVGAKTPLVERGVYSASRDPAQIREWWLRWPDANIAIAVPLTWMVVDVDRRSGGLETLARLETKFGALPKSPEQVTGGGGIHTILRRPAGLTMRGKLAQGIDLLGLGRYFVAAPSLHPTGARYSWLQRPSRVPIAEAPGWLVDMARAPEAKPPTLAVAATPPAPSLIERARRYLATCEPAVSGQRGHDHTFTVAQKLVRGFALDESTAFTLLTEWNERCLPPWSRAELARKIKQAIAHGRMPVGALRDRKREVA